MKRARGVESSCSEVAVGWVYSLDDCAKGAQRVFGKVNSTKVQLKSRRVQK